MNWLLIFDFELKVEYSLLGFKCSFRTAISIDSLVTLSPKWVLLIRCPSFKDVWKSLLAREYGVGDQWNFLVCMWALES